MNHDNRSRITVDLAGKWQLYSNTIPAGAEAVGTVTRESGETGALIKFSATGQYAQINAGAVRSLDGRKVAAALGKAGRPEALTEGRRIQVYLDAKTIDEARKLGDGNLSNGIRRALEQVASKNPA